MDELDVDNPVAYMQAKERSKQQQREQEELLNAYAHIANTDQGIKVIQDLNNKFILNNPVNHDTKNINYVAAYKDGEAGAVQYINHMITRGSQQ